MAINLSVKHNSSKAAVLKRLKDILPGRLKTCVPGLSKLEKRWTGDTCWFNFNTMGFRMNGQLIVTDSHVNLNLEMPIALKFFAGRIESEIKKHAGELFSKPQ